MDFYGLSFEFSPESLEGALRTLTVAEGCDAAVHVEIGEIPSDTIGIVYTADGAITITVPRSFEAEHRRAFFTHRWMCAWPLIVAARQHESGAGGACRLWLDDMPGGPGLTFCGNAVSHVLIPDSVFMQTKAYQSTRDGCAANWRPWRDRIDRVSWRGSSTGNRNALGRSDWRDIPRFRLCLHVNSVGRDDLFDVALSTIVQIWDPEELAAIAAAGIQRDGWPENRTLSYRYSIDIDGNSTSWPGLFTKLLMGTTLLKVDSELGFRQWYYDRLIPWRNFVPVSANLTDLLETVEWLRAHPEEAEAIAARGRELALSLTYEAVLDDAAARVRESLRRFP